MSEILMTITTIEVFVAFMAGLVFTVSYVLFFRWRKTHAGRAIMYLFCSWIAVTSLSLLVLFFGQTYFLREWLRLAAWTFVMFAAVNVVRVLWRSWLLGGKALDLESRHTTEIPIVDSAAAARLSAMSTRAELKAVTQVAHPWKATLRTAIQVGLPTLLTLTLVVPEIVKIVLEELGEQMPEGLRLWLLAAAGAITGVSVVLTRVMAIPAVNDFLTQFGLGATPKEA